MDKTTPEEEAALLRATLARLIRLFTQPWTTGLHLKRREAIEQAREILKIKSKEK